MVALALPLPARAAFDCAAEPRCTDLQVTGYPSDVLVPDDHIRVLLPAGYDAACSERYPVLYLLHGAGDTYRTWTDNTDVAALTSGLDLIVVMPDGGRNAEAGWYSDWADGSRDWETFHIEHMIPFVDATLCTDEHRAVAGLSMGGFGAMSYAGRHPGLFEAAASFSGAVDTMHGAPVSGVTFTALHPFVGTPDDRVWGNQVADEDEWRAHNPADLVAELDGTLLLIATGNGLPGGAHEDPDNIGGYATENGVWQMNVSFVRALDAAGVAHTDLFYGPGQHSWPYWRDALAWALPQILAVTA